MDAAACCAKRYRSVDDLVKESDLLNFEKPIYNQLTWKGKHYSFLANGAWTQVLWYNKTMFENAGVKHQESIMRTGNGPGIIL